MKFIEDESYKSQVDSFIHNLSMPESAIDKEAMKKDINVISESVSEKTEQKLDKNLRETFSKFILKLFKWTNGIVAIIVIIAFCSDLYFIKFQTYSFEGRLVTPNVLMMLIGATATQVAVAVGLLSKSIFRIFPPEKKRKK